jgi:ATP-dependent Lhr-like helicase
MMNVVLEEDAREAAWLNPEASHVLAQLRDSYSGILAPGTSPLELQVEGAVWHTFAGGAINRLLSVGLEQVSGGKWVCGNLSLQGKVTSPAAAQELLVGLGGLDWEHMATQAARGMARGVVSKFQPCLPQEAEERLLIERLLDVRGTQKFVASMRAPIIRSGSAG